MLAVCDDSILRWNGQLVHPHSDVRLLWLGGCWTVDAEVPLVEALHDKTSAGKMLTHCLRDTYLTDVWEHLTGL